ncbi:probable serine/threonine-protein kinase DDB_G0275165 [Planococcus citri]|uniref:probable serine/threonine-protein kinase DDB_G0275165 n=1 Tax=Planococcus citri TaxID=170843 RepID=UPI0031F86E6A
MSSPMTSTMWMDESEIPPLSDFEPSLMTTAICPMSVFDKFGWDNDILGPDTDELLDKICIKTEPDEMLDDKSNTDFGSLSSIFPDLIDDTKNSFDVDSLKSILSPLKDDCSLSIFDDDSFDDVVVKEESSLFDDTFKNLSMPMSMPVPLHQIKEEDPLATPITATPAANPTLTAAVAGITEEKDATVSTAATTTTTTTTSSSSSSSNPITNSIIRIPVKRSPNSINANFTTKPGTTGRTVKAVVVCPDRSKSIVCNVVRSSNSKSIVIQKPAGRSLLSIYNSGNNGSQRNEPKLPIKVNVITPKDAAFAKFKPAAAALNNINAALVKSEPAEITTETTPISTTNPINNHINTDVKVKMEYDEIRPETPQSLIGSDEEFFPFSSPSKASIKNFDFQDNFMRSCLLDEDNLCSESYKCMPPAEVTGQVQPSIPDVFKYTPNSSPTNNSSDDTLDNFYSKLTPNTTSQNQFYNKAAANVDHDYGFTCRTPKTNSVFCTDSLGIQTPSASEPPTDSDEDDDVNLLSDSTLLNDYECDELDREQKEYFEQLKRQLKMAELVTKHRDKDTTKIKTTVGSGVKERKMLARNRKRKSPYSKDKSNSDHHHHHSDTKIKISLTSAKTNGAADSTKFSSSAISTTGLLKVRLPAKDSSAPKRRKTSSGGRVFSPSERHLHNTNEQVRRIEMRQSFEELRRLIPKLYDKPRAPKVSILQEAKSYCDELFRNDCNIQSQLAAMKLQQERLRSTLSQLRRSIAASRY